MTIEPLLLVSAVFAVLLWGGVAAHVVRIDRCRRAARGVIQTVLSALASEELRSAPLETRIERVTPLLQKVSRDMVLHTAADGATPPQAVEVLVGYVSSRWGVFALVREASFHRLSRDVWRRTAALKILAHLNHPHVFTLLARAADGADPDVAAVAFALLGASHDPRAIDILVEALKQQRHPASRVALHLERSVQRPAAAYRELLVHPDATVRLWGATLLADYPDLPWVEAALAPLAADADARVRKAAIQSLGRVGDEVAAAVAMHLLRDPQPFVRAHAARALGELEHREAAPAVVELLGDRDWWVRSAAKQSLELMGTEVWPVLMRCLDHRDAFVRNGAAEVFQNLGILDNLIVLEAASDDPSPAKIDLLRRIASAGGTRLTDSLLERVGPATAPRVRHLLATVGLEQVGTY